MMTEGNAPEGNPTYSQGSEKFEHKVLSRSLFSFLTVNRRALETFVKKFVRNSPRE